MPKIDFNSAAAVPRFALKEWSATIGALAQGRQIVLLRKGGILDDDGVFQLEQTRFWLQPTYLHARRDAGAAGASRFAGKVAIGTRRKPRFYRAVLFRGGRAGVFDSHQRRREIARRVAYVQRQLSRYALFLLRAFPNKAENPLLCVALRVFDCGEYSRLPMQPQWTGCRSWIDLEKSPRVEKSRAVLNDEEFAAQLAQLQSALR